METQLVRLKPYDPRRGYVLRRYTFAGIRFQAERGWYRVDKRVADHLLTVRTMHGDPHAPVAFDVCSEAEARAMEASEAEAAKQRRSATDDLRVVPARATGSLLPDEPTKPATPNAKDDDRDARRARRDRE